MFFQKACIYFCFVSPLTALNMFSLLCLFIVLLTKWYGKIISWPGHFNIVNASSAWPGTSFLRLGNFLFRCYWIFFFCDCGMQFSIFIHDSHIWGFSYVPDSTNFYLYLVISFLCPLLYTQILLSVFRSGSLSFTLSILLRSISLCASGNMVKGPHHHHNHTHVHWLLCILVTAMAEDSHPSRKSRIAVQIFLCSSGNICTYHHHPFQCSKVTALEWITKNFPSLV